jgi:hypothetical protein
MDSYFFGEKDTGYQIMNLCEHGSFNKFMILPCTATLGRMP